jgi:hypothetical protein
MSYHRTQAANPRRDEAQIEQRRVEIKKNWPLTGTKLNEVKWWC